MRYSSWMGTTAPTFLVFSTENAPCRNRAAFVGFTFLVFSQVMRVLRSEVIVNLHVMRPTALTILQNACHTKRLGFQRWHTTECLLEAWMW